jgi:hypothetical protein
MHTAIARMKLALIQQADGTYKDVLVFRRHFSTDSSLFGKEVPRSKLPWNPDQLPDYFYFCGTYALQFSQYSYFFDITRNYTDTEAQAFSTQDLDTDAKLLEMKIGSYAVRDTEPYPSSMLIKWRDKCLERMLEGGMSEPAAETLFFLSVGYINRLLRKGKVQLSKEQLQRNAEKKNALKKDARYRAVAKMIADARIKASKGGIYGGFSVLDVFPSVRGSDRFIPQICPVLRIPLTWEGDNKLMTAPRVWRRTNTQPFGPDNVVIMSKLAAWLVEGTYALKRTNAAMDASSYDALREWKKKHPQADIRSDLNGV